MFRPEDDAAGGREVRLAFANVDRTLIGTLFERLARLSLPLAPPSGSV
jgi:hypothetical protein